VRRVLSWAVSVAWLLALPTLLVSTWWLASDGSDSLYFPPLRKILRVLPDTWLAGGTESRLIADVVPSLGRLACGYSVAAIMGITVGVLIGRRPWLRALVEPVIEMLRAVPPPAMVPVLVALAGIDNTMKVLVIVFGCTWPIMLNTVEGVRALDQVADETCRCYGVRGLGRLRVLVLPAASPQIITGLRQALSIAVILMVISEMMVSTNGLGFTVIQFQRTFALPEMWTGIIVLGLVGVALSLLFRILEARVLSWYQGQRRAHRGAP
jgi:ABC-type nitrate/sulfonate/bicarbonate transport system permease component